MVSDGFGPASETFAREYAQYLANGARGLPPFDTLHSKLLPLDTMLVGSSRTRSASSWVTDSAAGATAFSCGFKTYNGAVGVNASVLPCASVLEVAKKEGYMTGVVVTSRVTDATPASFTSHVEKRKYQSEIAVQQIGDTPLGRSIDLLMGGGRCSFLPRSHRDSCREDDRNLEMEAVEKYGYKKVVTNRGEALGLDVKDLPAIALLSNDHMPYALDTDINVYPSLKEMAGKALDLLTRATEKSDKGFFMLIEGSRIDMAAHDNDAAGHVHEIMAYQDMVALVKEYVDQHPGTLVISVSDHETGGLTVGRQVGDVYPEYEWHPEVLKNIRNTSTTLADMILSSPVRGRYKFVRDEILKDRMGLMDVPSSMISALADGNCQHQDIVNILGRIVSERSYIGWTTHGHTGVDVNLYAYTGDISLHADPSTRRLTGTIENIELNSIVATYLNIQSETTALVQKTLLQGLHNGTLVVRPPKEQSAFRASATDRYAAYHDF